MTDTHRKTATILAALRLWQAHGQGEGVDEPGRFLDVATDGGTLEPLDAEAIDALCEKIGEEISEEMDAPEPDGGEAWECLEFAVSLARDSHDTDADVGFSDHPKDEADCEDCRQLAQAGATLAAMRASVVTIEILGGCLSDVSGLLPGQTYTLIDHDEERR